MINGLLTCRCVYAIRAALLLATRGPESGIFVPIREIAHTLNISFHFLTKILQQLTEARILESLKGPKGGVGLARPAKHIRIIDIVQVVDGLGAFESCVLGLPGCGEKKPCPLHDEWDKKRSQIRKLFERYTLADMVKAPERIRL